MSTSPGAPDEPPRAAPAAPQSEVLTYLADLEAHRAVERAAAQADLRAADALIASATDPADLADAYADRAAAHGALDEGEQAMRDFAKAYELSADRAQGIAIKLGAALQLLKDGQRRVSFSWAVDAVNDDVGHAGSWYVLGLIAGHCEFFHFAIDALRRALALNPREPEAVLHLGRYLGTVGQFDEAADVLRRYVALEPNDPDGWFELGKVTQLNLPNGDRRERALEHYRRALAENPNPVTRQIIEQWVREIEEAERDGRA